MMIPKLKTQVLSLFLVCLLSHTQLGASVDTAPFNTYFCLKAPQMSTCPTPPTYDLIKLNAFAGKWYEIGSNARFKLYRENGMACNTANYTLNSTAPNFWGFSQSNLSILDTGVQTIGHLGQFGITQISTASKGICQNARKICNLMTSDSQLGQALTQLAATTAKILFLHPTEAGLLMSASANIGEAITSINVALDGLSRNVTRIQFLDAQLSQANDSVMNNLQKLTNVTSQTAFVQDAIQQSLKVIAAARGLVLQVTAKLLFAGGIDVPITSVPDLGKVVMLLAGAEQDIIVQASEVELGLFGINAMSALVSLDTTKPGDFVSSATGTAVQNSTFAGRLSANIHGKQAPFLILAVDGWPNLGYNAALIYSCTEVPNGAYKQGLFIISRTPTLDQSIVDRFLDIAKANGIYMDCDDPFLYTLQNASFCLPTVRVPKAHQL